MFATCGMMLMASAGDLVIVFLGTRDSLDRHLRDGGFRRTDVRSNESSMKYFILGSFSSAFLLYGIALIYGGTATGTRPGTTNIARLPRRLHQSLVSATAVRGRGDDAGRFRFQDCHRAISRLDARRLRGAPTPVTAFMAAGPKAAGFASFMRVFLFAFPFVTAARSAPAGYAAQSLARRSGDHGRR